SPRDTGTDATGQMDAPSDGAACGATGEACCANNACTAGDFCQTNRRAPGSCAGKMCGTDGCGSSCGTCEAGACSPNGICNCTPSCTGLQCGPDPLCGDSCGT